MNELALFAGAGGGILGGYLLRWRTVCAVECDPYAASILVQRQNDGILAPFPIWDNVQTFDGKQWCGVIDVVSGGFPCQPFSTAAHGHWTARDLWYEMFRIITECKPQFVLAENVTHNAVTKAKHDLENVGFTCVTMPLSASDMGADHIRRRYWLLAYTNMHSKLYRPLHDETQRLSLIRPSVWKTFPDESRVVDGLACRMDRLKATGNGQVPVVAANAFLLLLLKLQGITL